MITQSNIHEIQVNEDVVKASKKNIKVIKRKRLNNGIQSVKNPENEKKLRKKSNPKGKQKGQTQLDQYIGRSSSTNIEDVNAKYDKVMNSSVMTNVVANDPIRQSSVLKSDMTDQKEGQI